MGIVHVVSMVSTIGMGIVHVVSMVSCRTGHRSHHTTPYHHTSLPLFFFGINISCLAHCVEVPTTLELVVRLSLFHCSPPNVPNHQARSVKKVPFCTLLLFDYWCDIISCGDGDVLMPYSSILVSNHSNAS